MRRAVVIYERLIRRFTAQTTDYQVLLSTFAGGSALGPLVAQVLSATLLACDCTPDLVQVVPWSLSTGVVHR